VDGASQADGGAGMSALENGTGAEKPEKSTLKKGKNPLDAAKKIEIA
jgi:hypothetical protein